MIESCPVDSIVVGERRRSADETKVEVLAESIARIGLHTPITIRIVPSMVVDGAECDDVPVLVVGLHRLLAVKRLGYQEIDCLVQTGSEIDAKMWEIAENLHRSDLTALERAEHVAEWIRLEKERDGVVLAQVEPKPQGGRSSGGIRGAARELGIERNEAQRAVAIDKLDREAKHEAEILHLANNRKALLKAAKEGSKESQIRALREHAAQKASSRTTDDASHNRIAAAVSAVKKLSHEELSVFAEWFEEYEGGVFDATVGERAS